MTKPRYREVVRGYFLPLLCTCLLSVFNCVILLQVTWRRDEIAALVKRNGMSTYPLHQLDNGSSGASTPRYLAPRPYQHEAEFMHEAWQSPKKIFVQKLETYRINRAKRIKERARKKEEFMRAHQSHQHAHIESPRRTHRASSRRGILIFTDYRSGSTFLAEILKRHPDIFCLFEPLKLLGNGTEKLDYDLINKNGSEYLRQFYRCDFHTILNDSLSVNPQRKTFLDFWMRRAFCFEHDIDTQTCKSSGPDMWEDECKQNTYKAVKIIHASNISTVFPLMRKGYKVIHLLRDPRAVMSSVTKIVQRKYHFRLNSRRYFYAHADHIAEHAAIKCRRIEQNLQLMKNFALGVNKYEKYYKLIRYEDMAAEPMKTAEDIYHFLNIRIDPIVRKYVEWSTSEAKPREDWDPYNTHRNPQNTSSFWKQHLPFRVVQSVQQRCQRVLNSLGYETYDTKEAMKNSSVAGYRPISPDIVQLL